MIQFGNVIITPSPKKKSDLSPCTKTLKFIAVTEWLIILYRSMDMIKRKRHLKWLQNIGFHRKWFPKVFLRTLTNKNKQIWLTLLLRSVVVFFSGFHSTHFDVYGTNITPRIYQTAEMDLDIVCKKKLKNKW